MLHVISLFYHFVGEVVASGGGADDFVPTHGGDAARAFYGEILFGKDFSCRDNHAHNIDASTPPKWQCRNMDNINN